jgi:hypothetical protein
MFEPFSWGGQLSAGLPALIRAFFGILKKLFQPKPTLPAVQPPERVPQVQVVIVINDPTRGAAD